MNQFPIEIQTIIYRYINRDALHIGFGLMFPLSHQNVHSPFDMGIVTFPNGVEQCCWFRSEACQMCYSRNINKDRTYEQWIRCFRLLDFMNKSTSCINGVAYRYTEFGSYTEFGITGRLRKIEEVKIPRCLYSSLMKIEQADY